MPFDFAPEQVGDPNGEAEVFRWLDWDDIDESKMSLPIDKIVMAMIKGK